MARVLSQHKCKKTKKLLKEYEELHPSDTASIVTDALVGNGDHTLNDICGLLESELQAEYSGTNSSDPQLRYHIREWKTLCENLSEVPVSYTELRKYHPTATPETTPLSETRVVATGRLTTYQLTKDEYAILVCQSAQSDSDSRIQELKIVFAGSPAAFFNQFLAPNNWYRPKDVGQ